MKCARLDIMPTRPRQSSAETRRRIIDATIERLNAEGMMATTARAIAGAGGFNQALIYYHFDSLEDLFFEVVNDVNQRRLDYFGPRLDEVESLTELIEVAIELQSGAPKPSDSSAVALVVAGWSPDSPLARRFWPHSDHGTRPSPPPSAVSPPDRHWPICSPSRIWPTPSRPCSSACS